MPTGFATGALGRVLVTRGSGRVLGDLSEESRNAVLDVVALLKERRLLRRSIDVTVRAPREVVHRSLQLAVAAAALTFAESLDPLDDVAFTGALDKGGKVVPVGQVQAKRRVLDEEWPGSILLVPAESAGLRGCHAVVDLDALAAQLRGRPTVGWEASDDPAQVRAEMAVLREEGNYIEASRIAWALSRRRSVFPQPSAECAQLIAQLNEANNTGAQARGIRLAEALVDLLDIDGTVTPDLKGEALSVLARFDSSVFNLDRALARCDTAVQLAKEPKHRIRRLRVRARARAERLEFDAAVEDARASLTLAREQGADQLRSLLELGEWLRRQGALDAAMHTAQQAAVEAGRIREDPASARSIRFVRLLHGRILMDQGAPALTLQVLGSDLPPSASPGIETSELKIRALLALNRRGEAVAMRAEADRAFYGPLRGSLVGRLLALRQDLVIADSDELETIVRARIWRLPGFLAAYADLIPDTRGALLTLTPY